MLFEPLRAQKGLWMIDAKESKDHPGLLGQTFTADRRFINVNTPPNWVAGIAIFSKSIKKFSKRIGIDEGDKLVQVVSHELGHGISMWHHGEEPYELQGLQSGNTNCIMRYDNIPPDNINEVIGNIFCTSPNGTGTNAAVPCVPTKCYGDAAKNRGDCIHQFRISCRTIFFPTR